jgi:hypothetical protein
MGVPIIEELQELGFESAAKKVQESKELYRKTAVAYEHFDHVSEEDVNKFNEAVRKQTQKDHNNYITYDQLKFYNVKDYLEVPPADVLEKLKEAKKWNCFDYFEIAKIESVKQMKDPILFGRIKDCGDYFFIAQWDSDVTIEAIKKAAESK